MRALYSQLLLANTIIVNSPSALDRRWLLRFPDCARTPALVYNGVPRPPAESNRRDAAGPSGLERRPIGPAQAQHLALDAVGLLRGRGYDVGIEFAGSAFPGYEWYVEQLHAERRTARPVGRGHIRRILLADPAEPRTSRRGDSAVDSGVLRQCGDRGSDGGPTGGRDAAFGHLETISDGATGLLFPPGDVEAMADAIARIIDDDELAASFAEGASSRAIERFSLERYAAEIVAVIECPRSSCKRPFSR